MNSQHRLVVASSLLVILCSIGINNPAVAQFIAKPFIASDRSDTTDFSSGLVSGVGGPFGVRVNANPVPDGTYAGVTITPQNLFYDFQGISFNVNGPATTKVTVYSQRPGQHAFNYSSARVSEGITGKPSADGYQAVYLDARHLSIAPGSLVARIVVSAEQNNGSFLVKNIVVNGQKVTKSVGTGTDFYKIVNGAGSGPIVPERKKKGAPLALTSLSLTNNSGAKQTFYISLTEFAAPPRNGGVTRLDQVVFTGVTAPEGVITPTHTFPKVGSFFLNNGSTVRYTPPAATPCFSGNFYVNDNISPTGAGQQCPGDSQGGVGATFAEATINVDGQTLGLETVDVSEVNGVNALYKIALPFPVLPVDPPSGNYPEFFSNNNFLAASGGTTAPGYGTFDSGQFLPVPMIANTPGTTPPFTGDANATLPYIGGNGNLGVYPFGCDNCTSRATPGCQPASLYGPVAPVQPKAYCQLGRSFQYQIGGTLAITLLNHPYPSGSIGAPPPPPPPHCQPPPPCTPPHKAR